MEVIDDWDKMPIGICLIRMFHEGMDKHVLHLQMKIDDRPWHDQPHLPLDYSQEATKDTHREFWEWAAKNLPVFNYPTPVKSAR